MTGWLDSLDTRYDFCCDELKIYFESHLPGFDIVRVFKQLRSRRFIFKMFVDDTEIVTTRVDAVVTGSARG